MSSSDVILQILNALPVVAMVLIFGYAGYWALNIRHALRVRLYRNQALGIGLLAIAFILLVAPAISPIISNSWLSVLIDGGILSLLLYLIDASVLASRRSDPLLRDTLSWSKVRIALWPVFLICWGSLDVVCAYANASGNAALFNQYNAANPANFGSGISGLIINLFWLIPLASGTLYLSAIALRARDPTLKRHLKWFALFAVVLLVTGFSGIITGLAGALLTFVEFVLMGYFLYRSARSLVPLNKISPLEDASKVQPPTL
jgi:hypothetical protein